MTIESNSGAFASDQILRTLTLSASLDRQLKAIASVNNISSDELIWRALAAYLPQLKQPPLKMAPGKMAPG